MISINQFITLAIAAFTTLLFASACGQSSSAALKVKVASLERCGATQPTINLVKNTAKELGLDIDFQYVAITTPEQAKEHRHLGSPTIQINGLDIEPGARNADQFGIAWRKYGASEVPPKELLIAAFKEAINKY